MILHLFLYPFSTLYKCVTTVRNYLYSNQILKVQTSEVPTLCVGNLRVGGTGKSPFVEYLISNFTKQFKIAVLSRGYGRKTKGFIEANIETGSSEIGDEPLQYYTKFKDKITVYVQEDRSEGVKEILRRNPFTNLIILDDAFQHRPFAAKVNILLTEFHRPFFIDYLLPMGRLRESRSEAKRADFLIVTKCPEEFNEEDKRNFKNNVYPYYNKSTIFFTKIKYKTPFPLFLNQENNINEFLIITGIDNPTPFINHIKTNFKIFRILSFEDHYNFSAKDIENFCSYKLPILTTEKDAMRLKEWEKSFSVSVYYIPIQVEFLEKEDEFLYLLIQKLIS